MRLSHPSTRELPDEISTNIKAIYKLMLGADIKRVFPCGSQEGLYTICKICRFHLHGNLILPPLDGTYCITMPGSVVFSRVSQETMEAVLKFVGKILEEYEKNEMSKS